MNHLQTISVFYDQNKESFLGYARKRYGLSDRVLTDIYQDAILALYLNIRDGQYQERPGCSLRTYLFQIGINKIRDYLKLSRKEEPIMTDFSDMEEPIDESDDPELYRLVEQMPSPCRDILFAYYWDGCSMRDIARLMGYKDETVAKAQKYKCLQKVREMFRTMGFKIKSNGK